MRTVLTTFMLTLMLCAGAQDVIVKNDKSEIKAKVTEILDAAIKYKNWDNLEGPLYTIAKKDVFMIIYANGQREIMKKEKNTEHLETNPANSPANNLATTLQANSNAAAIDTTIDYKNIKIKYKPTRFLYWFDSPPTTLGVQQEMRIIKNTLNIGVGVDYFFISGYSQTLYSVYAEPYLPLNRVMGNYEQQDKGLFINGKVGYASLSVVFDGETETAGGLMLGVGADYFITKTFGLTVSGFKYKDSKFNFQGGICINVL
ncbi:MAG: hypothetical protein ACTHMD_11970 [Flavisolibacter sp.]